MLRVYITLFALLNHGPFKLSEHVGHHHQQANRDRPCGFS